MFGWGETDFVADPERVYEGIYEYGIGKLKVKSHEFLERSKGFSYFRLMESSKIRLFGGDDPKTSFDSKLLEIRDDAEYFEKRQIAHLHGFADERHNIHTKRYRFLVEALFSYYKDAVTIEHIKACASSKL
mmetsp:Transcript_29523/g.33828  ORF Transcript_29523/g.33828 Transcript_29523/m.33828 type:complete len:131 (+) Transcript_29523:394-786(+)